MVFVCWCVLAGDRAIHLARGHNQELQKPTTKRQSNAKKKKF